MYDVFVQLCQSRNVTPYQVAKDTGLNQSTLTRWKTGASQPRDTTLRKIAEYFGVTLAYLKGQAPASDPEAEPTPEELDEYLEMLRSRSECRMLFSLTKNATPEDVRRAVAVIEALRRTEGGD